MKATLVSAAALFVATVSAQVTYNPDNGTFICPAAKANGAFCASDSLKTNIIIRCTAGVGQPGNCNDNLAGVPPIGVKTFARCYQTSTTAGDAACSFNGTAYPDNGAPFQIPKGGSNTTATVTTATAPGTIISSAPTYTANGTGSVIVSATATPTPSVPPFTGMAAGTVVQGTALLGGLGAVAVVMGML